jgi:hypothetical protein
LPALPALPVLPDWPEPPELLPFTFAAFAELPESVPDPASFLPDEQALRTSTLAITSTISLAAHLLFNRIPPIDAFRRQFCRMRR